MGVNKVILVGNVGRDPELKSLPSGTNLCKFSLATNEPRFKDQNGEPHTEWHQIITWGRLAEFCANYVSKGRQLYIEGRIRTRNYERNGQKVYFTEIHADVVELLGSRGDAPGAVGGPAGPPAGGAPQGGFPDDADDVPF
jgi:single-strand DNA-binding protein